MHYSIGTIIILDIGTIIELISFSIGTIIILDIGVSPFNSEKKKLKCDEKNTNIFFYSYL